MEIKKVLFIVGGSIFTAIGAAGMVLPLLPATPFLILASICFARGSDRLHRLLLENRFFGPLIARLRSGKGLTVKEKIRIYLTVCIFIIPVMIFTHSLHLRIFLGALLVIKGAVLLRLKTAKPEPEDEDYISPSSL